MFALQRISVIFLALLFAIPLNVLGNDRQNNGYRLGVGDKLKVSVFGHNELSGEFVVSGDGEVVMPLIQGVRARNLTTDQLAAEITNKLSPDYLVSPKVSVELQTYRPFYIMGEVRNPGSYPYVEGMTALNAVALAGGYERRANKNLVLIDRKKRAKPYQVKPQTAIQPGDIITIKERFF